MRSFEELPVQLTVPCAPDALRLIRLVVASVSSDLGYDYEQVEDLRIAADEVCAAMISATSGRLRVHVGEHEGLLHVGAASAIAQHDYALDPLAAQIVDAIVASVAVEPYGDGTLVTLLGRPPNDHHG